MFSTSRALAALTTVAFFANGVSAATLAKRADNTIIFNNQCAQPLTLDIVSYQSTKPFNGPQPGVLAAGATFTSILPGGSMGFNGKVTTGSGNTSYIEILVGGEQQLYAINNSLGFTVGQKIQIAEEEECPTLICQDADCPCDQAIRTDFECDFDSTQFCNTRGTTYTVTYCP